MINSEPSGDETGDLGGDLAQYRDKRAFDATDEPGGEPSGDPSGDAAADDDKPLFVIQKHDASSLHYDFRLQIGGVLKSWAVPKGPSTDPRDKRLAIATEDHPLDYADFEGSIPKDEYGGGSVIIWDRGAYRNITEKDGDTRPAQDSLKAGHLLVWLDGEKLQGGYALQRIDDDEDQWLLVKMDDDKADARRNPTSTEPKSVVSGKTIDDINAERGDA